VDTSLVTLQDACVEKDDQLRWLVALLSDTGMRLAEAVGLHLDDILLDTDIPHLVIQPHPWRRLKTKSSKRTVPLVGVSLWAAQQVVKHHTEFAFPKYCDGTNTNSNSASAALNKWIKTVIGKEYVIHGLRHGLRDRLRAVECPSDIIDAIGGWTTEGVGQTYGKGYTLEVLTRWLNRITPEELCTPPR
jgi:integrase